MGAFVVLMIVLFVKLNKNNGYQNRNEKQWMREQLK